ncbi:hypothetical protein C8R42DRAFT_372136 [Lentinula raphanica]|nr:hypothetical protein C8R42DRAFT_372136 [Lentinula raphanica]
MSGNTGVDISRTFGALLIGSLSASFLSGAVTIQSLVYHKLYPTDEAALKILVLAIWLLDACHTGFIWASQWEYFIAFYGNEGKIDYIPTTLALSIATTGILTFLVQSFFAHRIFLSAATTGTMLHYRSFIQFRDNVRWLFTLGLALSSMVDIWITSSLFILLKRSKLEGGSLDGVIDTLILYTFETGSVTCAATVVSMICWIVIPTELIFMALHFVIGKFYATSLLVTLNTRRGLRDVQSRGSSSRSGGRRAAFVLDNRRATRISKDGFIGSSSQTRYQDVGKGTVTELQINVERSIQYTRDSF